MKRMMLMMCGLCLTAALFTGCANNTNDGPNMNMKTRTNDNMPLRSDVYRNDSPARILDIDGNGFNRNGMNGNGVNGYGTNRNNIYNGNGMNGNNMNNGTTYTQR